MKYGRFTWQFKWIPDADCNPTILLKEIDSLIANRFGELELDGLLLVVPSGFVVLTSVH